MRDGTTAFKENGRSIMRPLLHRRIVMAQTLRTSPLACVRQTRMRWRVARPQALARENLSWLSRGEPTPNRPHIDRSAPPYGGQRAGFDLRWNETNSLAHEGPLAWAPYSGPQNRAIGPTQTNSAYSHPAGSQNHRPADSLQG